MPCWILRIAISTPYSRSGGIFPQQPPDSFYTIPLCWLCLLLLLLLQVQHFPEHLSFAALAVCSEPQWSHQHQWFQLWLMYSKPYSISTVPLDEPDFKRTAFGHLLGTLNIGCTSWTPPPPLSLLTIQSQWKAAMASTRAKTQEMFESGGFYSMKGLMLLAQKWVLYKKDRNSAVDSRKMGTFS